MKKFLVYDYPVRLFHWLFAGLFVSAFFIAKTFDDDSTTYPYHMLIGFTMLFIVGFRIVWGIYGSRYARFTSFDLKLSNLFSYLKNLFKPNKTLLAGHNPASSWVAVIMLVLTIGLATTGYLMSIKFNKDVFEEIHELFANTFVIVAILHVAGVIFHTVKHKDLIGLSMIDGKKLGVNSEHEKIEHPYRTVGIIFILLVVVFVTYLNNNYDRQKQNLNLFGTHLQLGEEEKKS